MTPLMTRRSALIAAASLPFAPALLSTAARAEAPAMLGSATPVFNRFKLGGFEVTTLLAGTRPVENPHGTFGLNASDAEFEQAAAQAFLPTNVAQFFFTPTLVNTGTDLILFDTGLSAEGTTAALAAAGISPDQITTVVLTHMHGDHIGGLMQADGTTPTFAKARYVTGALEHNHWSAAGNEGFDKLVKPFNAQMTMLDEGGTVAPGITATLAPGHTPGHMIYHLESAGAQLVITADTANHYVFSLAHPEWEVKFDADKARAAQSRKDVFGMLAADRLPFIGYHMPFPGIGYVEAKDSGFRYVPSSYQMMLNG
jgi:glyoxylase-like metal-dependent hydrolase (beta-lactamase superfamily II)